MTWLRHDAYQKNIVLLSSRGLLSYRQSSKDSIIYLRIIFLIEPTNQPSNRSSFVRSFVRSFGWSKTIPIRFKKQTVFRKGIFLKEPLSQEGVFLKSRGRFLVSNSLARRPGEEMLQQSRNRRIFAVRDKGSIECIRRHSCRLGGFARWR